MSAVSAADAQQRMWMMERSAQSCVSKRQPIKLGFHQLTLKKLLINAPTLPSLSCQLSNFTFISMKPTMPPRLVKTLG